MRRTTLFSKRPVPGAVKTRLVPPLTEARAAALAEAMLRDALERCLACEAFRTALRFAPADAQGWYRESFPELTDLAPQVGLDLAQRLAQHFEGAFPAVRSEVVIGTDAPLLPPATIVAAHEALEAGADLALSLDSGGGYTLIGLRAPRPELFSEVTMSSGDMARRTLELARERGLCVAQLEPSCDVDTGADLGRLAADLASLDPDSPDYPTRTAQFVQRLSTGLEP